ncbi:glutamate receptor ionotropic, kainate 5-like [Macrobrachium rosenbergii]|uniref:glutamate receptor ionotropic, kainate 5-like n=1 Tax=Macrobrachium rosenbergii TaxID=79674 RepID=UPI0034D3DBF2
MISLETYNIFSKNISDTDRQSYEFSYDLKKHHVFPDRFKTFLGYHFHLASWGDDFPYIVKKEGKPEISGICFIMLREISRKLNFTFQVYDLPPDNQWGSYVNGSWRGMMGEVYYGHKDFGINQMDIVEDRFKAVDFSVPYWTSNSRFLIQNPEPPPRWSSIVFPFSRMTWVALAVTSAVIVVTYLSFFKMLGIHRARDLVWIILDVLKTILGLDSENFSYYSSVTLLTGIWRLAAMIISVSYRGNLVAYISVPPPPLRLKTLDQLASSSLIPLMTDYGSYLPVALRSSADPTLRTLGERLVIIPYDNRLAFDKVYEGRYAFLEESSFLHSLVVSYNVSNVYYLPEASNQVHLGWFFPKNTPWKYKFDRFLSIFIESGLTYYWYKFISTDSVRQSCPHHLTGQYLCGTSEKDWSFTLDNYLYCISLCHKVRQVNRTSY